MIYVSWLHNRPIPTGFEATLKALAEPRGPGPRTVQFATQPEGYPYPSMTNQRRDNSRRKFKVSRQRGEQKPVVRHVKDDEGHTHKIPMMIYRGVAAYR